MNGAQVAAGATGGTGVSITSYVLQSAVSSSWTVTPYAGPAHTVTMYSDIQGVTVPSIPAGTTTAFFSGTVTIAHGSSETLYPQLAIWAVGDMPTVTLFKGGPSQQIINPASPGYQGYTYPFAFAWTPDGSQISFNIQLLNPAAVFHMCAGLSQMTVMSSVADTLSAHFE